LTGGVPAIVLMIVFLTWFGVSTFGLWGRSRPDAPVLDLGLAQAASIVIVLLLLHSVLEFPLRITALSVLFAIACAYLIPLRTVDDAEMSAGIERFAPENLAWPRNARRSGSSRST
jgi:hypothetical protein